MIELVVSVEEKLLFKKRGKATALEEFADYEEVIDTSLKKNRKMSF